MQFCWLKFFIEFVSCVYFLCILFIKPLTCIVFDSDCLKRSYGVYYTVTAGNKIPISNVRIINVFLLRTWNSFQGPFIYIRRVIFQRPKSYFFVSVVFCFRDFSSAIYQRVIWYRGINYAWPRDIFLRICENEVNQSGGVTSYPGWTIYQLAQTIHWAKFFVSFYFRQQIFIEYFNFIWLIKNIFVLKE